MLACTELETNVVALPAIREYCEVQRKFASFHSTFLLHLYYYSQLIIYFYVKVNDEIEIKKNNKCLNANLGTKYVRYRRELQQL
jgi:hypothetical protein